MADLKTRLTLNDKNFSAKLDSACKKAQSSLGQLSKTTKGLGGVLGSLGGQLGGTIGSLTSLAGSFSSLLNPVTAAGVAIGAAAVAFTKYNVELEKTQRLTSQFTGLEGNQLSSLNNGIRALADSTGHEFGEMLHAVEEHAKVFGISFEESLQDIQAGFVAGADEEGNFLDKLKQYGPAFKDLGVNGQELTAIIAQTRNGLFNDEGLAAITMASKNIGNMSAKTKQDLSAIGVDADAMIQKVQSGEMSGFQAVQQIAQKMKEAGRSSQEYGAVLQDVFGKKGTALGSPFIDTLSEMSTNLEEVKGQTGEQGQVMDELINTTRDWNNACETLFGMAGSGFADMGKKMKIFILQNLTKIINKFVDLYNKSTLVRGIINGLGVAFKAQWEVIKAIFKAIGQAIEGIAAAFEDLINFNFGKIDDDLGQTFKAIGTTIKDAVSNVWDAAKDAAQETINGQIVKVTVEPDVQPVKDDDITLDKDNDKDKTKDKKGGKGSKTTTNKPAPQEKEGPREGSIDWYQDKLQELNKAWKAGTYEGTIEQWKADVEKYTKILNEKLNEIGEGKVEIDPESYEGIGQQLSELKQKYAQGLLKISPEEYEKQVKELERKQHNKGIEQRIIVDDEDLKQQIDDILEDPALSTFELYVKPHIDRSFEGQIAQIQEKMNSNDQKIVNLDKAKKELDDYKEKWGSLSEQQQEEYARIVQSQKEYEQENQVLGQSAVDLSEQLQKQNKMSEGFNAAADAANNLGSVLSAAGAEEAGAIAGIAGTIAQTIGQVIALMTANGVKSAMALPFPANLAAAATVMAGLATIIGQIKAAMGGSFASGGIVGGGKYYGDKNIVNVDSGEMILNRGQQGRLWNMINSNTTFGSSEHGKDNVQFVLRGSDLYGSISNYKKITKK